jgi:tRNA pseudouridine55 synthase
MVRVTIDGAELHGVLVIDKPLGPTSHDVVARLRRTLGTRAVGHAGTLDPAASGVLVVAIGQATKLVPHLTSQAKSYDATIAFGTETTTLDAEGDVVREGPIPAELARELAEGAWSEGLLAGALAIERNRGEQVPPAFSAIKQNGRSVHVLARRGEHVELAARPVHVHSIEIRGMAARSVDLRLTVAKGYYVRSLARDLGAFLGVPSHLAALRRTASGPFTLREALAYDAPRELLVGALESLAQAAARVMPVCRLLADGADRARHGRALGAEHFVAPPGDGVSAWLDPLGQLVAVGSAEGDGRFVVGRGFAQPTSSSAT